MVKNYKLLDKKVKFQIKKIDGFYSKIYSDGRIYIPEDIIENQKLKHSDIVLIKGIKDGKIIGEKYSKVHCTKRKNRKAEYLLFLIKSFMENKFFSRLRSYRKRLIKKH